MKKQVTRRDFLKVASLFPLIIHSPKITGVLGTRQNIIVIVFDALSASNISLYGYQRDTMPNLARLSKKAITYHNHYSTGNFTTPGTASLLTGTYPWTHRAIRNNGTVDKSFSQKNIFSALDDYYRLTYSHNPWVYTLLEQFHEGVEEIIPLEEFLLLGDDIYSRIFKNDNDISTLSKVRTFQRKEEGYSYSLFLTYLYEQYQYLRELKIRNLEPEFPRGIPSMDYSNYFLLEQVIDWIGSNLKKVSQPFISYFHFWPPHEPYRTRQEYYGKFENDSYQPVDKPHNPFSYGPAQKDPLRLPMMRTQYDESILYADGEFGRLYDLLERSGLINNTWIILTSDHGELFERGIEGHSTPVLYQPLIHIPLIIFEPERTTGMDVFTPTSAIDVLPTLLQVTGHKQAPWSEGNILPPFNSSRVDQKRSIYTLEARTSQQFAPFNVATSTILLDSYKLIYYFGYDSLSKNGEQVELYDIGKDPEELNDLHSSKKGTSDELLMNLKEKIARANFPYEQ